MVLRKGNLRSKEKMSWAGVRRKAGNKGDLASPLGLTVGIHSLNPCTSTPVTAQRKRGVIARF